MKCYPEILRPPMAQVFNAEVDALDALDTLEGRDAGAAAFLAPPPRRPGLVVGTGAVQVDSIGFYSGCVLVEFWTFWDFWSIEADVLQ